MNLRFFFIRFFLVFIFYFYSFSPQAQVVINEFSCSNISFKADNYGNYEDWIELYNTGSSSVNLTNYYLSDDKTNLTKWQISSATISGNGYLLIYASGKNITTGTLHTSFKLTQTKPEAIVLSDPFAVIVDSLTILPAQTNHSRGRTTDGASTWSVFTTPTPNAANTNAKQEYASRPIVTSPAGFYSSAQTIFLLTPDTAVAIHYTTDGSTPTTLSPTFGSQINISTTTVVRARAFSNYSNIPASFVESNTYFINSNHTVAVVSVFGDSLGDLLAGSYIDPQVGLEYFDNAGQFQTESYGVSNKHGNDSWAYNQRGIDFISVDEYGYNYALQNKLFHTKTRQEFQRIILKASANDNYPFETGSAHIRDEYVHTLAQRGDLHLDARTWEPCILYANGKYWGVYDLREKVDDNDYTDYYYNQKNIQMLKTWGWTWSEYGGSQSQTDWNSLLNFITTNNMAVQSNYNYVDSLYNIKSLTDYFVLNSYVVCSDWLNWNTEWWRGMNQNAGSKKWKYCLWDEDATFGHYINYTGIPDQTAFADPCNPQALGDPGGEGHVPILNALLNNPTFKQYYISRFIDLSNTTFNCTYMQALLDSMIAVIQPEMQGHCNKWGGNVSQWQSNVQTMKTFIDTRCTALAQGLVDCYQLSGPFKLTFNVAPAGTGNVKINSITPTSYAFSGNYFGNIDILLKATADSGYVFDHWELFYNSISPSINDSNAVLTLTKADSVIAHFKPQGQVQTYNLIVIIDPPSLGNNVKLNLLTLTSFPWSAVYPVGTNISLSALPAANYNFNYWELHKHSVAPDSSNVNVAFTTAYDDTVTAHFLKKEDTIIIPPLPTGGVAYVPTGFSPNDDNNNDVLYLYGSIAEFELVIYNRWGQQVFRTTDQTKGWDGTFDGTLLNSGVFAYKLKGKLSDGTEVNKHGNITLMR